MLGALTFWLKPLSARTSPASPTVFTLPALPMAEETRAIQEDVGARLGLGAEVETTLPSQEDEDLQKVIQLECVADCLDKEDKGVLKKEVDAAKTRKKEHDHYMKERPCTASQAEPADEAATVPMELGSAAAVVSPAAAEEVVAGPAAAEAADLPMDEQSGAVAAHDAEVPLFTVGDRVQLLGLLKASHLNGQAGIITFIPETGRLGVQLQSGTLVCVHRGNLKSIAQDGPGEALAESTPNVEGGPGEVLAESTPDVEATTPEAKSRSPPVDDAFSASKASRAPSSEPTSSKSWHGTWEVQPDEYTRELDQSFDGTTAHKAARRTAIACGVCKSWPTHPAPTARASRSNAGMVPSQISPTRSAWISAVVEGNAPMVHVDQPAWRTRTQTLASLLLQLIIGFDASVALLVHPDERVANS